MFDRRAALIGGAALLLPGCRSCARTMLPDATSIGQLRALEQNANGRLGAYVVDLERGTAFGWRENDRFTHASSFKMSLAAMLLAKADAGKIDLRETLHWTKEDMLSVSPVTAVKLGKGLSVRDLARATLITTDNTAANVLMRRFGGPSQLTAFWRSIGDKASQLDRSMPSSFAAITRTCPAMISPSSLMSTGLVKPKRPMLSAI